jgi:hypothetical protein
MHTTTEHSHAGHSHSHGAQSHTHEAGIGTPASCASVALDVGAGRGALVIYPSERFRDTEIEISHVGEARMGLHTGVHERRSAAGSTQTAIFGSLAAGDYVVWSDGDVAATTVSVPDGAVAEIELD